MPDLTNPHFDLPFRFGPGGIAVCVEQDSADDVANCVEAIMRTTIGQRVDVPDFGIPEPTFEEGGPVLADLTEAVQRWEPRADATLSVEQPNYLDQMYYKVTTKIPVTED